MRFMRSQGGCGCQQKHTKNTPSIAHVCNRDMRLPSSMHAGLYKEWNLVWKDLPIGDFSVLLMGLFRCFVRYAQRIQTRDELRYTMVSISHGITTRRLER